MAAGYIALNRDIFDNRLFQRSTRPQAFSWREAWIWLMVESAWRFRGHRTAHGLVDNSRGELSFTQHELACVWHWTRSKVRRFLQRLAKEGMITLKMRRPNAIDLKNGPKSDRKSGYARMVVTLCGYDSSQPKRQGGKIDANGKSTIVSTPKQLSMLDNHTGIPLRSIANQRKQTQELASETVGKPMPRHGQRIAVGGREKRFFRYGSEEWRAYVKHLEDEHGVIVLPTRYLDGQGKWFYVDGNVETRKRPALHRA